MQNKLTALDAVLGFYEDIPVSADVPFKAYHEDDSEQNAFLRLRMGIMNAADDHAPATEASFAAWGSDVHTLAGYAAEAVENGDMERALDMLNLIQRNMHAFSDAMAVLADEKLKVHYLSTKDVLQSLAEHLQTDGEN